MTQESKKEKRKRYLREWMRQDYKNNPEKRRQKARDYYHSHREAALNCTRNWGLRNRAWRTEYNRKYRKEHPDVYKRSLEHQKLYSREYRKRNREKCRQYSREWRIKNRAKSQEKVRRRRALIAGVTVNPTGILAFTTRVRQRTRIACYYCGKIISGKHAHIDHIVALAKGGNHEISNLCVSCPACNLSKQDTSLREWSSVNQLFLPV